jgi:hypothetical protein
MSYLTLSGFNVPVSVTSASFASEAIGGRSRAFSGQALPERRALVRTFTLGSPVDTRADAQALIGLIEGNGHKWNFDADLYSSKGLGPQAGYTITMSATGGVISGYVQVTSAQSITWRKLQYSDYSVMIYKYTGGAWHQYVLTYDISTNTTVQYKDGAPHSPVAGDSILNWFSFTTSTGDFTFLGKDIDGANANARYDELVIVPWLMTASMVSSFHAQIATAGIPFSELPLLNVAGDIIPDGPVQFVGAPISGTFEPAQVSASESFGMVVNFELAEFNGRSL